MLFAGIVVGVVIVANGQQRHRVLPLILLAHEGKMSIAIRFGSLGICVFDLDVVLIFAFSIHPNDRFDCFYFSFRVV